MSSFYKSTAKKRGIKNPKTGAITFIQWFGGNLNLNIHFHTLFLDGVCFKNKKLNKKFITFKKIKPPSTNEVREINLKIKKRFIRALRKKELIEDYDEGKTQFIFPKFNPILEKVYASSIQRKIAWGKRKGKKSTPRRKTLRPLLGRIFRAKKFLYRRLLYPRQRSDWKKE